MRGPPLGPAGENISSEIQSRYPSIGHPQSKNGCIRESEKRSRNIIRHS